MRVRLALTLLCALAAVLTAGPAGAQTTVPSPGTDTAGIGIGHPRAAVLTVFHSGAESFLLLGPASRDEPLRPTGSDGTVRLWADYEALFMPLTAGWTRFKLEAWHIVDGGRELLDEGEAEAVDFGPSRHAGRLGLKLRLKPGLHQIELISTTEARAVGVTEWTTDRDAVIVWVLIPNRAPGTPPEPPAPLPIVLHSIQPTGEVVAQAPGQPGVDPTLPLGGLFVGGQRGVSAAEAGGALNFETGHNRTLVVRVGEKVRVWTDYELWWAEEVSGEAGVMLVIRHRPAPDETDKQVVARADFAVDGTVGPRLEDGNLLATFRFERPGVYPLSAILHTGVRMGDLVYTDEDTVPFTVRVLEEQPQVGAIAGRVTGEDGPALEGVEVEATDRRGRPIGHGRTNAQGRYVIEKLVPGEYLVHALPGDLDYLDEWWKDSPTIRGADPVEVKAGAVTLGVDFALTPGGTITGRVTNAEGEGLGGIEIAVGLLRQANEPGEPVDPDVTNATVVRTKTNDEGYYSINKLRANAYWVRARDPEGRYLREYYDDKPSFAEADRVWVEAGEVTKGIDFELEPGGAIAGLVREETVLGVIIPLAGIVVQVRHPDNHEHVIGSAITNHEGRYRIGGLRRGKYLVRAGDPSGTYLPEWFEEASTPEDARPVPVEPGETTDGIGFTLEPGPHETVVFISPPRAGVPKGGSGRLSVMVEDVQNLGAFETEVAWNPEILQVDRAVVGAFLGSTGRKVVPVEPVIDNEAGRLRFGAATIGNQPGPNGRGVLFTFTFTAKHVGETDVEILASVLTTPAPEAIEHTVRYGWVTVSECMFGDFDCNCIIDIRDVMAVVVRWGTREGDPDYDPLYDLDEDGDIDIVDVQIETGLWGRRCDDTLPEPLEPLVHDRRGFGLDSSIAPILPDMGPSLEISAVPAVADVGQWITVAVDVVDAVDLAGFDMWLTFDAERVRFVDVELGDLLGSTGRTVLPLGPNVEDGRVALGAFTLPGAPAPTGSGRLATLTFEVVDAGTSTLEISEATLTNSLGESNAAGGPSTVLEGRGGEMAVDVFIPFAARGQ